MGHATIGSARVVETMRRLRHEEGWSAERLAVEVTTQGPPWTRNVVMNLETGRKTFVTVDELLALAVVFGVPVEDLLGVSDDDLSTESLARARDRKLNTAQRLTREAELLRTEAARLSGLVGTVR